MYKAPQVGRDVCCGLRAVMWVGSDRSAHTRFGCQISSIPSPFTAPIMDEVMFVRNAAAHGWSQGRAVRDMQRGPDHPEGKIYLGDFGTSQPEQVLMCSLMKYYSEVSSEAQISLRRSRYSSPAYLRAPRPANGGQNVFKWNCGIPGRPGLSCEMCRWAGAYFYMFPRNVCGFVVENRGDLRRPSFSPCNMANTYVSCSRG